MDQDKEIREFTHNIGAKRIDKSVITRKANNETEEIILSWIKKEFKKPNYILLDNIILIVKISRIPKPFYGITKKIIDDLYKIEIFPFCLVLLKKNLEGWIYSSEEIFEKIKTETWKLATDGNYKINENTLRPDHRFKSTDGFLKKFELIKTDLNRNAQ